MKTFATLFIVFGVVLTGFQWWQIGYRLHLFYHDYEGKPYLNHVGDGDFALIHIVNFVALAAGALTVMTYWRKGNWRWIAVAIIAANGFAWVVFAYMHSTGALVEYREFIRHMKSGE